MMGFGKSGASERGSGCKWRAWRILLRASVLWGGHEIRQFSGCSRKHCVKRPKRQNKREAALQALRKESERDLLELIRRRLALPIEKR